MSKSGQMIFEPILKDWIFRFDCSSADKSSAFPSLSFGDPKVRETAIKSNVVPSYIPTFDRTPNQQIVVLQFPAGTSFYGTGEASGPLERTGTRVFTWNTNTYGFGPRTTSLYQSHPWVLALLPSGEAFGVLANTIKRCEIDLRTESTIKLAAPASYPLITFGPFASPNDVLVSLSLAIGTVFMPPKWSLGYHQCRWSYTSDKRVLEVAKTFRDKSIPCDVIWMDIDYMDGFRCFTFDNKRFSDPKSLVKDHHLNGIKAIWMLDPGIKHENSTDSGTEGSGDQSDDSTARKIKELIDVLDLRKDESIERTFKGVARNFREVFSELVQGGHGVLVMMKKKDGDQGDDEDDDGPRDTEAERRVEKYIGVKVKVSFTGQGETQSMKQLSGGQKTVVALALIFAIQRCDPAPFIFLMKLMQPLILSTELPLEFRLFADNSLCQFRFSPCKQ